MQTIMVSTVDNGVVVIFVDVFFEPTKQHPDAQLCVTFGKGKDLHCHINSICFELGEEKSRTLPFCHTVTISQFKDDKKSYWEA